MSIPFALTCFPESSVVQYGVGVTSECFMILARAPVRAVVSGLGKNAFESGACTRWTYMVNITVVRGRGIQATFFFVASLLASSGVCERA